MDHRVYSIVMPPEEDWGHNLLRHRRRLPLHFLPVHPYHLHSPENHDVAQQQQEEGEAGLARYDEPFVGYSDRTILRRVLHGSYYISFHVLS